MSVTASASQSGPEAADRRPSFDALRALVADDMAKVNETIIREMHSPVALIPQLAGHIVASGGKRLRPMLTLAAAGLVGYEGSRHIDLAACVEFIHTATLLHDDVVDESNLRRGKDTANAVWGNQASVLVGDFLFSRAFQLMVADGSLKVLKILSDASAVIAEGEVHQLVTTNDIETTEAAYLQVIESKTAVLFAAASQIGAVVAERPESEERALESFGRNLGVAFQLVDDVLDYSAQQEALGKTVGDDFREGKMTLPVILAYAAGDAEERAFWSRVIGDMEQDEGDLAFAQALMAKHGTLAKSLNRARDYAEAAHRDLDLFAPTAHRRAMEEVIDFCVDRAY
ncbi:MULTISPECIES: polyprenyl synthetase family protein [Thalassobaculum]|uniref:Octaprenyl diphosphate synthase n=1 Tax=Thalassobaculum litoreum DSM 18839 TaxID=1123362 RepID=A0A8G2EUE9_9PROT|nr:octaprenyl-diphosphate synthase [Thalassobaculum litoreum DSM 18839]